MIKRLIAILAIIASAGMVMTGCSDKKRRGFAVTVTTDLTVGQPFTANFANFGEVDEYCVQLEGGTLYRISTSNLSAQVDTFMQLLAENGFLLLENDNSNGGLGSEIFFWSPVDAKFIIRVSDLDNTNPEGVYDILVEFVDQTGPTGPPGPQGDDGEDGEDGNDGQDGQDGEDGEDGEDGAPPPLLARYRLCNHPDGAIAPPHYGLRLDELFDVTEGHDRFTFDFNAPGSYMYLDYDGVSIRIHGIAFGGRDKGGKHDPEMSGYAAIDFTYPLVIPAPGDDDLTSQVGTGTVVWKTGTPDAVVIPLIAYAGNHPFAFRFGDENNDNGHRGFKGFSGWGWLNHGDDLSVHHSASDWLFTVCKKKHKRDNDDDDEEEEETPQ